MITDLILQIDSTAIVNGTNILKDIGNVLIPKTEGGAIANAIITIVGALIVRFKVWKLFKRK